MKRQRSPSPDPDASKRRRLLGDEESLGADPFPLLFLPIEMRSVIRSFLEPKERIALHTTCQDLYEEDPGFILPAHLLDYQRKLERDVAPLSVFAVDSISAMFICIETVPSISYYTNIRANMTETNSVVFLKEQRNYDIPMAICGLAQSLSSDYSEYPKYATNGRIDPEKVHRYLLSHGRVQLPDSDDEGDNDFAMEYETPPKLKRNFVISEETFQSEMRRRSEKYSHRRALVVYAKKRHEERQAWREAYKNRVLK